MPRCDESGQCECGLPVPHLPHERAFFARGASLAALAALEAKVENFFVILAEPHSGQGVPTHSVERTSTSESSPHCSQ
jgi:hypothetical protein